MPTGVDAVFPDHREAVDLDGLPDPLITKWMLTLDSELLEQKKREQESVANDVEE